MALPQEFSESVEQSVSVWQVLCLEVRKNKTNYIEESQRVSLGLWSLTTGSKSECGQTTEGLQSASPTIQRAEQLHAGLGAKMVGYGWL